MSATEAHEHAPFIDYENIPAPTEGILVTHFITVRSIARSRAFYSEVLGGRVVLEDNPCIVKLANSWVLMHPGGPPTPDKPDISVVNYEPGNTVSTFMNLRVADIQACYRQWSAKGAEFVTPPIDLRAEIRCYMRDPDGYMIEVGQATGALHGELAEKRPEDLPAKGKGITRSGNGDRDAELCWPYRTAIEETMWRSRPRARRGGSSVTDTRSMLDASPSGVQLGAEDVAAAIDACLNCVQACTSCANADLAEENVEEMRACIALDQDCADVCAVTARVLSRPSHSDHYVIHRLLQVCVRVCTSCAEECARHADHHRHCSICAKACRACEAACSTLLEAEAFEELQKLAGG